MADHITWYPADLFSKHQTLHRDFALIVLNQPLELRATFYSNVWQNAVYHVAADGGANRVHDLVGKDNYPLGLDTIIGDLDSIRPAVKEYWRQAGTEIIHDFDQESTDFGKATKYLKTFEVPQGAKFTPSIASKSDERQISLAKYRKTASIKDIVCLGGLGGRLDQGMATIQHLYKTQLDSEYSSGRMFLLSSESITFVLKAGFHRIKVREAFSDVALGKHIGIIPIKEASIITTTGLQWDVTNWKTEFGGQISTSNHVREEWVTVATSKDVLFTIDMDFPA